MSFFTCVYHQCLHSYLCCSARKIALMSALAGAALSLSYRPPLALHLGKAGCSLRMAIFCKLLCQILEHYKVALINILLDKVPFIFPMNIFVLQKNSADIISMNDHYYYYNI